jgi:hypothetical protein
MSERALILKEFAGMSIRTTGLRMMEFEDTGDQTISRIVTLSNGTKWDLDGTADSDITFGQTIAVFACRGATKGFDVTNAQYRILAGLRGKSGTLKGVQIAANGTETVYTCTARLMIVRPKRLRGGQDTALAANRRPMIEAECVWERKTAWAVGS